MASTYDFVVVGSGPAGCSLAAELAKSSKKPSVLLIEDGESGSDRSLRVAGQRWTTFTNKALNRGYKTTPQEHCGNRELDYSRGHCLGGSSAVNFGVFSIGARDDYDEWARIVGDDAFRWEHIQNRLKRIEILNSSLPAGVDAKYAAPKAADHGSSGPLNVGYAPEWEEDLPEMLDAFQQAGFPLNQDHNSGNPLGMSVTINTLHNGLRSTAIDLITPTPDNLTIVSGSPVQRVLLDGKKAIGVESNGKKYLASKEVILSAGALDTPRILMHSGIGPAKQLNEYKIPVVQDVPAVGQGLRDHMFIPIIHSRKETKATRASFYGDPKAMETALEQWKKDGTGPWSKYGCSTGIGWFKLDDLPKTKEFKDLPADEQRHLLLDTIPHYEVLTHFPIHWIAPGLPTFDYSCLLVWYYNAQSRGEVTLQSSDPNVILKFDPKFLASPFDRRVAIEALRKVYNFTKHEAYDKDNLALLSGPKSDSDEDLLEYWVQNIGSSWHMTGTAKMGNAGDADAVVDKNFKVTGIDNLRVADMSVVPVLASCHTQAVAYVTGATAADKLVQEYNLA
ncbi:putative GMC oxidoreductase [Hypoxylon trugodes]|uniref:putative GMC oxidoreductase n=1 Tax=Hypoxylon trugodes TaxID=326681 RepID=UPI002192D4EC|nr:putative GMC oxidoreductase [Hypoxylon trugodes]KAI1383045.1 putative GMC oxidoreductase [Hypoxylon trugodes]